LRFTALLTVLGVLICVHPLRSMAADLPDVLWNSVQDQQVVLQLEDGSTLTGALTGFDDTSAVMILEDGSVLAVQRSDVASIKLAEAPASAPENELAPATGSVAAPATPIEPVPDPPSETVPAPIEIPIEVQVKVDELRAQIDANDRAEMGLGMPGALLTLGGLTGILIAGYKEEAGHRNGFGAMLAGGICLIIPALVASGVSRAKGRELQAIEAQYPTAGLVDFRPLVAVSPEAVTIGFSASF